MNNGVFPINSIINNNRIIDSNEKSNLANGSDFSNVLQNALNDVIEDVNKAEELSIKAATGEIEDLSELTIAMEKASLGIQLTVEVKNKVIEAYQEIMRMQI